MWSNKCTVINDVVEYISSITRCTRIYDLINTSCCTEFLASVSAASSVQY